ncbi:MAG: hypothetical protein KF729_06745 [Sandaracinaceae bacterium]|nr:hypothetical protein [Sandaracinaceae bacterium]
MTKRSTSWLALFVWIAGCGGGCGGPNVEPASGGEASSDSVAGDEASAPPGTPHRPAPAADVGPPPVLRVSGERERAGGVAIRIENRGDAEARLAGRLALQHRDGGRWAPLASVSLDLRYSCEDRAPECVTLAPGASYLPPRWLGMIGDAQCACERCTAAPGGEYRFVVQSCDRAHTIEGEPFALP